MNTRYSKKPIVRVVNITSSSKLTRSSTNLKHVMDQIIVSQQEKSKSQSTINFDKKRNVCVANKIKITQKISQSSILSSEAESALQKFSTASAFYQNRIKGNRKIIQDPSSELTNITHLDTKLSSNYDQKSVEILNWLEASKKKFGKFTPNPSVKSILRTSVKKESIMAIPEEQLLCKHRSGIYSTKLNDKELYYNGIMEKPAALSGQNIDTELNALSEKLSELHISAAEHSTTIENRNILIPELELNSLISSSITSEKNVGDMHKSTCLNCNTQVADEHIFERNATLIQKCDNMAWNSRFMALLVSMALVSGLIFNLLNFEMISLLGPDSAILSFSDAKNEKQDEIIWDIVKDFLKNFSRHLLDIYNI